MILLSNSTKGTILFVTGAPKPTTAEVMLKFKSAADGGRAVLPEVGLYVCQVLYQGQPEPTNQLLCQLKGEFTASLTILADVRFHGLKGPPLAFLAGANFDLIEGGVIIGAGRVTSGDPAFAPGIAKPVPVIKS